ncbi:response regulator, partial [Acinetobacter baumannii]
MRDRPGPRYAGAVPERPDPPDDSRWKKPGSPRCRRESFPAVTPVPADPPGHRQRPGARPPASAPATPPTFPP